MLTGTGPVAYNCWLNCTNCIHGGEQGSTGYVKRKWRVVVDQLATLKADHNFNCQRQLRFGCLKRQPGLRTVVGVVQKFDAKSESPRVTAWYVRG